MNTIKKALALTAAAALALGVSGCSNSDSGSTAATKPTTPTELLAAFDLDQYSATELIDHLDRVTLKDREADLRASIRADEILLSTPDLAEPLSLPIDGDQFYLSFAPYVKATHDCFYHSLTTCQGELQNQDITVTITDNATGEALVDESATTFDNGFIGYWLPKDIQATLTVTYGDYSGEHQIGTGVEDGTCLSDLQLT